MSSFYKQAVTAVLLTSITPLSFAASLVLKEGDAKVTIDPATLAIDWQQEGELYRINEGELNVDAKPQTVSDLQKSSGKSASWVLQPGNIEVKAALKKGELKLVFDAGQITQPQSLNWFSLPDQKTQALLLPVNEGAYIPTDNQAWADYVPTFTDSDTTQGLKMPFWSQQLLPADASFESASLKAIPEDARFVSLLMVNPFNNELTFDKASPNAEQSSLIEMQASHQFKPVSQDEAFEVLISLGDDPLSGARRYRDWRIEEGDSETLKEKMKTQPGIQQLIGASHVYLFGAGMLAAEDVSDWKGLREWFLNRSELAEFVKADTLKEITGDEPWINRYQKGLLVEAINAALYDLIPVAGTPNDEDYVRQQYLMAQKQRAYLEKHAGAYLIPAQKWGQGLSAGVVNTLEEAGLEKLWLGVDKWMSAFYQPDAVKQAQDYGYLVATYDSYNTGIPKEANESWISAHLPDDMRNRCAIVQADGTRQSGFRGNGYYQNPVCGLEYVQSRISDIIKLGGFDSYFLDVDATGMVRDDYNPMYEQSQDENYVGMPQSEMAEAYNDRMSWIDENQDVVLGSEDGSSVTTQGIVFAHGMETVGFGWTDKDMTRNRQSPYYLGPWYPENKPAYFFKTAEVKEPYDEVLFSPEYKLPLYQTVFNNEVINSHHWHSDSLKFSDVQDVRDIASMMYVTPAMVHLSRDEATSTDSPRVQALLHYQEAFQPLHEALWDETLDSFEWLTDDGMVQKVEFSDGSVIIGNYSNEAKTLTLNDQTLKLSPASIEARLMTEEGQVETLHWQHKPFSDFSG